MEWMALYAGRSRRTRRTVVHLATLVALTGIASEATAPVLAASRAATPHLVIKHHDNLTETYLPGYPLAWKPPRNTRTARHISPLYQALEKTFAGKDRRSKKGSYFALDKSGASVAEGVAVPMGIAQVNLPDSSFTAPSYRLSTWVRGRALIQTLIWQHIGYAYELIPFNSHTGVPAREKPFLAFATDTGTAILTFPGKSTARLAVRGGIQGDQFFSSYLRGTLTLSETAPLP